MNYRIDITQLLVFLLAISGIALLLALLLAVWALRSIRRVHLPPDADFMAALRVTPLPVVIVLDLLDLSLDIFSAPIAWFLLGRLGLAPLRGVTVLEGVIPFTGFIPLMTVAWVLVRLYDRNRLSAGRALFRTERRLPRADESVRRLPRGDG